tara:strand:- start:3332 stop:3940 length:609 start_codon:yes stop_codon:yes gene_type:complete
MKKLSLLLLTVLFVPWVSSAPQGIGDVGGGGCICHGSLDESTELIVFGLPNEFESNTSYNFSLEVRSPTVNISPGEEAGGFRIDISSGDIEFDEELALVQKIEEGWTHTTLGNKVRSWNFTYISPSDNSTYTDITINGNAVNGNDQSTGDAWNGTVIRIPGTSYTGDLEPSANTESLGTLDYAVGSIAILGLLVITVLIIKD